MNIERKFIKYSPFTRPMWKLNKLRGIVIHYTANNGGTADNHFSYFNSGQVKNYASAHYFVDKHKIVQIIPDNEVAFHVNETTKTRLRWLDDSIRLASGNYYRGNGNVNTLGIEMCLEYDGSIHPNTLKQTKELTVHLMRKYSIPLNRVIRHYDQTWKMCPKPFVVDSSKWTAFKNDVDRMSKGNNIVNNVESDGELTMSQYKELLGKIGTLQKENTELRKEIKLLQLKTKKSPLTAVELKDYEKLFKKAYNEKVFSVDHSKYVKDMSKEDLNTLVSQYVARS